MANIVVWPPVFETYRRAVLTASLLRVDGRVQRQGQVIHVIAERIGDLTAELRGLGGQPLRAASRDFC